MYTETTTITAIPGGRHRYKWHSIFIFICTWQHYQINIQDLHLRIVTFILSYWCSSKLQFRNIFIHFPFPMKSTLLDQHDKCVDMPNFLRRGLIGAIQQKSSRIFHFSNCIHTKNHRWNVWQNFSFPNNINMIQWCIWMQIYFQVHIWIKLMNRNAYLQLDPPLAGRKHFVL